MDKERMANKIKNMEVLFESKDTTDCAKLDTIFDIYK
jgi:hypothetical protein